MATVTYGFGKKDHIFSFFEKEKSYTDGPNLWMTSGACFSDFAPMRVKMEDLLDCPVYFIINSDKKALESLIKYLNDGCRNFKISLDASNDDTHLVSIEVNSSKYRMSKIILEYLLLVILRILEKSEYDYRPYNDCIEDFNFKKPLDSVIKLSSSFPNMNHSIVEGRVGHSVLYKDKLLKCLSLELIDSANNFNCFGRGNYGSSNKNLEYIFQQFKNGQFRSTYYIGQTKIVTKLISMLT